MQFHIPPGRGWGRSLIGEFFLFEYANFSVQGSRSGFTFRIQSPQFIATLPNKYIIHHQNFPDLEARKFNTSVFPNLDCGIFARSWSQEILIAFSAICFIELTDNGNRNVQFYLPGTFPDAISYPTRAGVGAVVNRRILISGCNLSFIQH
jgi:hypothetical protein